jgi:hypothetical protein
MAPGNLRKSIEPNIFPMWFKTHVNFDVEAHSNPKVVSG